MKNKKLFKTLAQNIQIFILKENDIFTLS